MNQAKNIVESKSLLAKLMASENITVQHLNVSTASFDVRRRVLTCPIWKDMDGHLYDLLMGHEVGHALETPECGWHDAIVNSGKFYETVIATKRDEAIRRRIQSAYKSILNVVEDARIEKKIQRRYPGLKKPFAKAYADLHKQDFFKIKNRDVNKLNIIDRINLHFKLGYLVNVKFSDQEQKFIKAIESAETWDDVEKISTALYKFARIQERAEKQQEKKEKQQEQKKNQPQPKKQEQKQEQQKQETSEESEDAQSEKSSDDSKQESEEKQEQKQEEKPAAGEEKSEAESKSEEKSETEESNSDDQPIAEQGEEDAFDFNDESDDQPELDENDNSHQNNSVNEDDSVDNSSEQNSETGKSEASEEDNEDDFIPESETDKAFRENESSLVNKIARPHYYVKMPEPRIEKIIVANKDVYKTYIESIQSQLKRNTYGNTDFTYEEFAALVNRVFIKKNQPYISLLSKEFEMRKNADQYFRQLESKSGELDMRKLHKYRFSNEIFRKVTNVDKGKSHGMILFLDMSSSMDSIIKNTIEQLLVLVSFCKIVGIPFDVYGFCDIRKFSDGMVFHNKRGCMRFRGRTDQFHLKHLISSKLNHQEYRKSFDMLLTFSYFNKFNYLTTKEGKFSGTVAEYNAIHFEKEVQDFLNKKNKFYISMSECGFQLGGTPLIQTIAASKKIIENFKNDTKVDIINVIHLTDGDNTAEVEVDPVDPAGNSLGASYNFDIYIQDEKTKHNISLNKYNNWQNALTKLVRDVTGARHIGFYVGDVESLANKIISVNAQRKFADKVVLDRIVLIKEMKEKKHYQFAQVGFDNYYYVAIEYDDNLFDSRDSLVDQFINAQNAKKNKRVILTSFAKDISNVNKDLA